LDYVLNINDGQGGAAAETVSVTGRARRFRHDRRNPHGQHHQSECCSGFGSADVVDVDHGEASFAPERSQALLIASIDAAGYWSYTSITAMRMSRSSWKALF